MRLSAHAIAGLAVVLGCGGSGGVGDGGVPPNRALTPRSGIVVVEEPGLTATELARALCGKAAQCASEQLGALTQDECALYFSLPCFFFSDVRAEDGLAACLASIRAADCAQVNLIDEACQDAFARARARATGLPLQTEEGGVCGDGVECAGGMVCESFDDECSTCVDGPRIGEPCEDGCWTGYCDRATNLCAARKEDGVACASDEECDSFDCSSAGLCKPSRDVEECSLDDDCLSGRCIGGVCAERQPPGGPCTSHGDCEEGFCDEGVCKLLARCALGRAGEPCAPIGCFANLQCIDGVCVEPAVIPAPNGAPCSRGEECESGYCSFATGARVCRAKGVNLTCEEDEQCESGQCVLYRCAGAGACEG